MEKENYEDILKQCKKDLELIMAISSVASKTTCIEDFESVLLFNELHDLAFDISSLLGLE